MKKIDSLYQCMTQMKHVVNKFCLYGENISDQKVLMSLTKKFDMVVVAIEEAKNLTRLPVEELMGSLSTHETRLQRNNTSLESAFQSHATITRGRGQGNKGRGHSQSRDRFGIDHAEQSHAYP